MGKRNSKKVLVVAVYQESLSWLDSIDPEWERLPVRKDIHLPNTGRETSSYFWAMDKLYGKDGTFAFLQGGPHEHCRALPEALRRSVTGFTPIGDLRFTSYADGSPTHSGLPVKELYETWIGPWPGRVDFTAGAQFLLTGKDIQKYPRSFYRQPIDGDLPWACERLWESLYTN